MNRFFGKIFTLIFITFTALSCSVKYSFTGASIAPEVKTFSVQQFLNSAAMVAPILTTTLTDELVNRFTNQTALSPVKRDGDFAFEGIVTNYTSQPVAISGGEYATMNRLSITVSVKFVNRFEPKMSFNKSFTRYADFDSNQPLQSVEMALIPDIVEQLVTDIFNAAASNW